MLWTLIINYQSVQCLKWTCSLDINSNLYHWPLYSFSKWAKQTGPRSPSCGNQICGVDQAPNIRFSLQFVSWEGSNAWERNINRSAAPSSELVGRHSTCLGMKCLPTGAKSQNSVCCWLFQLPSPSPLHRLLLIVVQVERIAALPIGGMTQLRPVTLP